MHVYTRTRAHVHDDVREGAVRHNDGRSDDRDAAAGGAAVAAAAAALLLLLLVEAVVHARVRRAHAEERLRASRHAADGS